MDDTPMMNDAIREMESTPPALIARTAPRRDILLLAIYALSVQRQEMKMATQRGAKSA